MLACGVAWCVDANFQGNCSNRTVGGQLYTDCQFSPNKAPSGEPFTGCGGEGGVSYYGWTFGDFGATTTSPALDFGRANYTYVGNFKVNVELTVHCNSGVAPSRIHCLENYGPPTAGCIYPGLGWSP